MSHTYPNTTIAQKIMPRGWKEEQLRVKKEKQKQEKKDRGPKLKKLFAEAFDGVDLKTVNMRLLEKSLLRTFRMTTHEPWVGLNPMCYGDVKDCNISYDGDIQGPSGPFGIPFVGPDSSDIPISYEATTDMQGFKMPLFERLYMDEDDKRKNKKDYQLLKDYEQKFYSAWDRIQSRWVSSLSFSTIVFHTDLTPKKELQKPSPSISKNGTNLHEKRQARLTSRR